MKLFWFLIYLVLFSSAFGCRTSSKSRKKRNIEDFGLDDRSKKQALIDEGIDAHKEKYLRKKLIKSSLPLAIRVGRGSNSYFRTPTLAYPSKPSIFSVRIGKCALYLSTDTLQVDRYISLAGGEIIKMKESLVANDLLRFDAGMDFFFRVNTYIQLAIPKSHYKRCRKYFLGKKFYVGNFTINKTWTGFLAARGSPSVNIYKRINKKGRGKKLYIKWDIKSYYPMIVDDLDLPANLESDFYRASFRRRGFYYLMVKPNLSPNQLPKKIRH